MSVINDKNHLFYLFIKYKQKLTNFSLLNKIIFKNIIHLIGSKIFLLVKKLKVKSFILGDPKLHF